MKTLPMKISFILQDVFRQGAEYATAMIASGLAARGHEVEIVVSAWHNKIAQERPELQPFDFKGKVSLYHLPHFKARQNLWAMRHYINAKKTDAIVVMNSTYLPIVAGARLLAKHSPVIIHVDHSCGKVMKTPNQKSELGLGCLFRRTVSAWALRKADGIFAVSIGTKENLIRSGMPENKISVVYNPVVADALKEKLRQPAAHPWLANKTVPVIVAAGALCDTKGFFVLLDALRMVKEKQDCRLVIFGEGPLKKPLLQNAQSCGLSGAVSLPGYTNNLPPNIKAADMFIVSSFYESFSIVLVEALACGTPVVSTNCPVGPPEILAGGKYGILTEVGNPVALAQGIQQVLNGKGIPPPPESWQPYCIEAITDRYENGILSAIQRHGRKT